MAAGLPLGAHVRGSSAWIVWQLLRDSLRSRIRQLELDPGVHPDVVRQLHATAADLEEAAQQYREWQRNAADSVEVSGGGAGAGLACPVGRWDASTAAASLGCSERWVT
jgi:hypothetical protein